jgi:hypothetical protein
MYKAAVTFRYTVGGRDYVTPAPANYSSSNYQEKLGVPDHSHAHPLPALRPVRQAARKRPELLRALRRACCCTAVTTVSGCSPYPVSILLSWSRFKRY